MSSAIMKKVVVLLVNAKEIETADRYGRDIASSYPHGIYKRQFLTIHFPAKAIMRDIMKKNPETDVVVFGNTNTDMKSLEQYKAAASRFDKKYFVGALNFAYLEENVNDKEEFLSKAQAVVEYEKSLINMHMKNLKIDI